MASHNLIASGTESVSILEKSITAPGLEKPVFLLKKFFLSNVFKRKIL